MGVWRKSLLVALASALAFSACQQPASMSGALVIPIRQLDDEGACATAGAPSQSYNDALGWQWFESGGTWCRRQFDGGAIQAWAQAEQNATHRLHLQGGNAGLTDALPTLRRLQPGEVTLGSCEDSRRMRAFRDQNWLVARGDLDCRGHRAATQQVVQPIDLPVGGQRVPVLMSRPTVPDDRGTIIFLAGGPYRNLVRGLEGHALTNHLLSAYGPDTAVLVPAYAGIDKVRMGDGDLARATAEIAAVMAFARERRRPVCVVAYDMGAYAVAPLVGANAWSGFLMLAPPTSAPASLIERMKANGMQAGKLQLIEGAPDARMVEMTSDQALLRYAGAASRQDLNERLDAGRLTNVEMAYAPNDPVVGPRDVANLSSKMDGRVTRLPAVGHAAEDAMGFMAYQPVLDRFLSSCLANPAN